MTARLAFDTYRFFATCPRNTEGLLVDELQALGADEVTETRAGVAFSGPLVTAYRACLWSRVASRVLLQLASFPVGDADQLYETVGGIAWQSHLGRRGTLAVEVTSAISRGPLAQMNTHFAEQRVKDAIVDQFRAKTGVRPSGDLVRPDVRINVHLEPEQAIVSLDLSGDALHRRGYRLEGGAAPLKENLAAAVLIRAGWPEIARNGGTLVDPMCGSGTFLVEGALIAGDVAPGLLRTYYGFLGWAGFDPKPWEELLAEAYERRMNGFASLVSIYGFDADPRAVDAARANVRRAELAGKIFVEKRDLSALTQPRTAAQAPAALAGPATPATPVAVVAPTTPATSVAPASSASRRPQTVSAGRGAGRPGPSPGLVIANPPYGKRLGEQEALVAVYEKLGEKLKEAFAGWDAAIITGNPALLAHLGMRARRTNVFYNGPILCRLLVFDIDPRAYGTVGALRAADAARRVSSVSREKPATPEPNGAAPEGTARSETKPGGPDRELDGSVPREAAASAPGDVEVAVGATGGPLAGPSPGAEMFANRLRKNLKHLRRWATREDVHCFRAYDADLPEYAVAVDLYENWAHVQEYSPPQTVDPVQARRRLKEVMAVVPEVLGIPLDHAVLKVRRQQRGADQYQRLDEREKFLEVREGGLRFLVNLTDYLDTGLFLDHRLTRALIRELAPGRHFLNLFAYTGTTTVYAAAGEATSTTTVDLSANYLDWAHRNLELNGLTGPQHRFVRADCLVWLEEAAAAARRQAPGGASRDVPSHGGGSRGGAGASAAPAATLYDLIFLDAPTFSNSKRMDGTLDVQRDHVELIRTAAMLLSSEGILLFSTNFRRFKLDPVLLEEFHVDDIAKNTLPPDFERNPRIRSCFRIMRRGASRPVPSRASQTTRRKEPHAG